MKIWPGFPKGIHPVRKFNLLMLMITMGTLLIGRRWETLDSVVAGQMNLISIISASLMLLGMIFLKLFVKENVEQQNSEKSILKESKKTPFDD
jgi:hypothetical protein